MKIWKETIGDGYKYYSVSSRKVDHKIISLDKFKNDEELTQFLNENAPKHSIGNLGPNRVHMEKGVPDNDGCIELPFGCYYHYSEKYPVPERFQPVDIRSDSFIQFPEQDQLKTDIDKFLCSKDVYDNLGFTFRRGYLVHGPPGNGKTGLIRSLAKEYKDKTHIFWLSEIPSSSMLASLNKMTSNKIVIFEEIVNQNNQLDFHMSEFLMFLDGESSLKNSLIIATTNYPEMLQKNLADRPSRFDVILEIKEPTESMTNRFFEQFLKRPLESNEIAYQKFSIAQIKEIVLLHKLYDISLTKAAERMKTQSEAFKRGFQEKKSFGLMND